MRKVAVIALILLLIAGIAYGKEYEYKKKAGEYEVQVKIDRNPPVVGDNTMKIGIEDASGNYVTDAKVVVEYSMPPMPGMPAMNYRTDGEVKGNEYRARLNLSMAGSWNIMVKITRAGKTSTMKFTVDAK